MSKINIVDNEICRYVLFGFKQTIFTQTFIKVAHTMHKFEFYFYFAYLFSVVKYTRSYEEHVKVKRLFYISFFSSSQSFVL